MNITRQPDDEVNPPSSTFDLDHLVVDDEVTRLALPLLAVPDKASTFPPSITSHTTARLGVMESSLLPSTARTDLSCLTESETAAEHTASSKPQASSHTVDSHVNARPSFRWFPGCASITFVNDIGRTETLNGLDTAIIAERSPLLAQAFEYGTSGPRLHLETLGSLSARPFVRFLYTGTYAEKPIDTGGIFEDVPTSVLMHCQLFHLGHVYNLPELQVQGYVNILRQFEFGCSSPDKPIDLCRGIRYIYYCMKDLTNFSPKEVALGYCVEQFERHQLSKDSSFIRLAYQERNFRRDLQQAATRDGFHENFQAILRMPYKPYDQDILGQNPTNDDFFQTCDPKPFYIPSLPQAQPATSIPSPILPSSSKLPLRPNTSPFRPALAPNYIDPNAGYGPCADAAYAAALSDYDRRDTTAHFAPLPPGAANARPTAITKIEDRSYEHFPLQNPFENPANVKPIKKEPDLPTFDLDPNLLIRLPKFDPLHEPASSNETGPIWPTSDLYPSSASSSSPDKGKALAKAQPGSQSVAVTEASWAADTNYNELLRLERICSSQSSGDESQSPASYPKTLPSVSAATISAPTPCSMLERPRPLRRGRISNEHACSRSRTSSRTGSGSDADYYMVLEPEPEPESDAAQMEEGSQDSDDSDSDDDVVIIVDRVDESASRRQQWGTLPFRQRQVAGEARPAEMAQVEGSVATADVNNGSDSEWDVVTP